VDELDVMDMVQGEAQAFADELSALTSMSHVKLCITSRPLSKDVSLATKGVHDLSSNFELTKYDQAGIIDLLSEKCRSFQYSPGTLADIADALIRLSLRLSCGCLNYLVLHHIISWFVRNLHDGENWKRTIDNYETTYKQVATKLKTMSTSTERFS